MQLKMRKNIYHFNRSDDLQTNKVYEVYKGVEKDSSMHYVSDPNLYC